MNLKTLMSATALALASTAVSAQNTGDMTVGVGASTFGLNLEGAYQLSPQMRARCVDGRPKH
jgi:hypothetical protein